MHLLSIRSKSFHTVNTADNINDSNKLLTEPLFENAIVSSGGCEQPMKTR